MTTHNTPKEVFIHESAVVDEGARLGKGTRVWHFSHICAGAQIGEDCNFGQNCYVAPTVVIGNRCRIQNNVSLYDGVTLEDEVFCGPSCVFTNDLNPRANPEQGWVISTTRVQKGASIGANATVVCGNTIGSYALIGSGAVVTRNVPAHALMVGVPATQIGWVCTCGERLTEQANGGQRCPQCHKQYALQ